MDKQLVKVPAFKRDCELIKSIVVRNTRQRIVTNTEYGIVRTSGGVVAVKNNPTLGYWSLLTGMNRGLKNDIIRELNNTKINIFRKKVTF